MVTSLRLDPPGPPVLFRGHIPIHPFRLGSSPLALFQGGGGVLTTASSESISSGHHSAPAAAAATKCSTWTGGSGGRHGSIGSGPRTQRAIAAISARGRGAHRSGPGRSRRRAPGPPCAARTRAGRAAALPRRGWLRMRCRDRHRSGAGACLEEQARSIGGGYVVGFAGAVRGVPPSYSGRECSLLMDPYERHQQNLNSVL